MHIEVHLGQGMSNEVHTQRLARTVTGRSRSPAVAEQLLRAILHAPVRNHAA